MQHQELKIVLFIKKLFVFLLRNTFNFFCKIKSTISWRCNNSHNMTKMGKYNFSNEAVVVGKATYGVLNVINNSNMELLVGNYCSIADDVVFALGADHQINTISTYPFKVKLLKTNRYEAVSKGNIIIDDDVWIGQGAIILSGVHIYQGAIVAAGSVVTKDVLPYSVVGGVPAKVLKLRFTKQVIDFLLTLDYSALTNRMISEHIDDFYTAIDDRNVEELKKLYEWFPKK